MALKLCNEINEQQSSDQSFEEQRETREIPVSLGLASIYQRVYDRTNAFDIALAAAALENHEIKKEETLATRGENERKRQQFSKIEQKSTMGTPMGKRPTTKAEAMDGFSFGFLTRLPKFRPQIQF